MTVEEIGQAVKDYCNVGTTLEASDLVVVNRIVLQAINHSRLWAERKMDFALALTRATVSVSPSTGASLATCIEVDTGDVISMKSIESAYLTQNNTDLMPITVRPRRTYVGLQRKANDLTERCAEDGYNPTPVISDRSNRKIELHTFGGRVFLEPPLSTDETVTLDGTRWLLPYAALDETTDFLTEFGSDFLTWKAIKDVNYRLQLFVPRQEGSLPPPTEMIEDAWESLVLWDSYMHEGGRSHDLGT